MVEGNCLKIRKEETIKINNPLNLTDVYNKNNFSNSFIFERPVTFKKAVRGLDLSTFFVQQPAITPPSGGGTIDSQARTAIGTIITTLQTLLLTY